MPRQLILCDLHHIKEQPTLCIFWGWLVLRENSVIVNVTTYLVVTRPRVPRSAPACRGRLSFVTSSTVARTKLPAFFFRATFCNKSCLVKVMSKLVLKLLRVALGPPGQFSARRHFHRCALCFTSCHLR